MYTLHEELSPTGQAVADLLRVQLQIEIHQAAINTLVWQAAVDALTPPKAP